MHELKTPNAGPTGASNRLTPHLCPAIRPLITGKPDTGHALHERHVCVDTTAAGGNAERPIGIL